MEPELYCQIKFCIKKMLSINLDHYKDEQMRRRLDTWLVRCGGWSWDEYFARLRSDPQELSRFRDYLTINVSSFFRDIERWERLREIIEGELLKNTDKPNGNPGGLRIWSAGCSIGAEPFSLAMLLDDLSPGRQHYILATDLDRSALAKARARGPYNAEEIQNLSPAQCATYLEMGGPPYYINERVARKIEFREHDMLVDPFPKDLDLIVCRNVVIYFTTETQEALYRQFQLALKPGGILFAGATEIIPRSKEMGLRAYGFSFYQRA